MENMGLLISHNTINVMEAMQKIDNNSCGILFLIDDLKQLKGCLTDGDIRRFILSGGKLTDNVNEAANMSPKIAKNIEEARKAYHQSNYIAIPIIDDNGLIIDIYTGEDKCNSQVYNALNIPVVINAGGKGTRLDPLTRVLPKPLIPVGELPIIELIMKEFQLYSCNKFHIIVNYKKELLKAYFSENDRRYDITWYDEEVPLGTGGGLTLLRGKLNETFFFVNCDVLLKTDYENLLKYHKDNRNIITMVCACKNISIPYGVVEMGKNGVILSMKEKPQVSFLTNTGIYILEADVIERMENGVSISFPDVVEKERLNGQRVAVYPVPESNWMDMGQIEELEKMRVKLTNNT